MMYCKFFFLVAFNLLAYAALSQIKCDDYDKKKCEGYGPPFKYSGQSKSAVFEKGQTSSFYLVTYSGYEYCITVCSEKRLKDTFFKIKEDNVKKAVLYDSSIADDDILSTQFYIKKSKRLIVEVTVPEGDLSAYEEKYKDRIGCVAVVVEYVRAPNKGFE